MVRSLDEYQDEVDDGQGKKCDDDGVDIFVTEEIH
jgi:hypothetical protein